MMLLAPFALLLAFSFTQAAIIDAPELAPIRGDRLSIMPAGSNALDTRATDHHDCEYSGIIPGVIFSGVSFIVLRLRDYNSLHSLIYISTI
jgi:hypothetical protein